jgi:3-deoxy-D-manno-octulosonic-acid transferase
MKSFWYLFYNGFVIPLAKLFLFFAKLFNSKINSGIKGRKKLFENLIIHLADINRKKKMIWFHSASMGEFEQAKPIIEKIRSEKNVNIVLSFFSPSGYLNSLKYPNADIITYFPYDTPIMAARFLNLVRPNLAILMRYEVWPNMIWQLEKKNIPCFIVDATMRKKTARKWIFAKDFHKSVYKHVTRILTVSKEDLTNYKEFNINDDKIKAVGDTRFDRVYQKSLQAKEKKLFKDKFFAGKKVFVIGSSWENDEEVVLPALLKIMEVEKNILTIIVPHEPTLVHIERLENLFHKKQSSIRFSLLNNYSKERIIIIDSIGILLTLYYHCHVAYVGGSFKQGIHNVLEPAVYGIPVLFGPKHGNSQEAVKLAALGGGIVVQNKKDVYRTLRKLFSDEKTRKRIGKINSDYVKDNIGATSKIISEIYQYI